MRYPILTWDVRYHVRYPILTWDVRAATQLPARRRSMFMRDPSTTSAHGSASRFGPEHLLFDVRTFFYFFSFLRRCDMMSGADTGGVWRRRKPRDLEDLGLVLRRLGRRRGRASSLSCYAACGTEAGYAATWRAVLRQGMLLRGVRY
eukprot:1585988-Rhodomonas_salina.1